MDQVAGADSLASEAAVDGARRVVFQGQRGAYSHLACRQVCPHFEALPAESFEDAFAAVREGRAERAMIPIDNSVAGRVAELWLDGGHNPGAGAVIAEAMADPGYGVEHSGNTPGAETLIILNGPIIEQLGFNCTQGRSGFTTPCTAAKAGAIRINKDVGQPLYLNLIGSAKPLLYPQQKLKRWQRVKLGVAGGLRMWRYGP